MSLRETSQTNLRRKTLPTSLLWLIGFNLLGRVIWILYMHPKQLADFDWYFTHAVQMANGQGYMEVNAPTAYWPMGWPFILSIVIRLFGPHVMAGLVANAIFSTLIVWLVYALTFRILGTRHNPSVPNVSGNSTWKESASKDVSHNTAHRIAMTAAIGYSLLPSQIEWNAILGSEESFTLLLVLSLFVYAKLVRRNNTEPWFWRTAAAGVIFGLASIVRPIGLLFPVFLAAYEFWVNRRQIVQALLRGITFGVSMLIGIAPITIRNAIAIHHFILVSTNGGVNLWQGTKINGGYFWTWNPYRNPLLKAGNNQVLENQIGKQVSEKYILHHPLLTLLNGFHKVFDLYKVDTNAVWYTFNVQYPHSNAALYTFDVIDTLGYWFMMFFVLVALLVLYIRSVRNNLLISQMFSSPSRSMTSVATSGGGQSKGNSQEVAGSLTENADTVKEYARKSAGSLRRAMGFLLTFILYNTLLFLFFPAWDRFRYPLMPLFAVLFAIGWFVLRGLRSRSTSVPTA